MMSEDGGSSPASEKFSARGGQSQLRACPMARRSRVAEATLGSRKSGIHARWGEASLGASPPFTYLPGKLQPVLSGSPSPVLGPLRQWPPSKVALSR